MHSCQRNGSAILSSVTCVNYKDGQVNVSQSKNRRIFIFLMFAAVVAANIRKTNRTLLRLNDLITAITSLKYYGFAVKRMQKSIHRSKIRN